MGSQFNDEKVKHSKHIVSEILICNCFFFLRYDDQYHFVLTLKDINTGNVRSVSLVKSVAHFIDVDGYVVHENVEAEVSKMHNSLLSDKKDK